jgi:hypothetical protein
MNQSSEIADLYTALSAAQAELENPTKSKEANIKPGFRYRYADIADVLIAARKVLAKQGLAIIQATVIDGNSLVLRTRIAHKTGQFIEADYPVCVIGNDHRQMGAALTYARRYALCPILGIASDDDTDAQGSEGLTIQRETKPKAELRALGEVTQKIDPSTSETTESYASGWLDYIRNEADPEEIRRNWKEEAPRRAAAGVSQEEISLLIAANKARIDELPKTLSRAS